MGYVDNNLMSGESIVYKANIHWFIFVPGGTLLTLGILTAAVEPSAGLGMLLLLLGLFFSLKAAIVKFTTELAVTSKRVVAKYGLISRSTIELNHDKVESLNVEQSILGRIFGFGTLVINGTGGNNTPIPNIDAPLEFRREAMQTVDAS